MIDYKSMELGVFNSCESSTISDSNGSGGSDNYSFPPSFFSRNNKLMVSYNPEHKGIENFETHYISEERTTFFRRHVNLSSSSDEPEVIQEVRSMTKRANMEALSDSPSPYFCLHIPIICYLEVLVLFSQFKAQFLKVIYIAPSYISRNG